MRAPKQPRKCKFYGQPIIPLRHGETWLEGEEMNRDYGQFRRFGMVRHAKLGSLVFVKCDVPDTFFSIPAITATEHGYVTVSNTPEGKQELEFRPHTDQSTQTPAEFRRATKKAYK